MPAEVTSKQQLWQWRIRLHSQEKPADPLMEEAERTMGHQAESCKAECQQSKFLHSKGCCQPGNMRLLTGIRHRHTWNRTSELGLQSCSRSVN